jgi:hypothetical protein
LLHQRRPYSPPSFQDIQTFYVRERIWIESC